MYSSEALGGNKQGGDGDSGGLMPYEQTVSTQVSGVPVMRYEQTVRNGGRGAASRN
jgi:hypothetical protein